MASENDDDLRHNEVVEDSATTSEKSEKTEREPREAKDDKPKDIRAQIKAAIKEHAPPKVGRPRKDASEPKSDDGATEPASKDAAPKRDAPSGDKAIPKTELDGTATTAALQAPVVEAAPAALSKEIKAQWDKLDPSIRNEFLRREADTSKGVEQLKARYQPYDEALAPVRDELRMLGKTEAEAIKMLVDWRRALSGPNKAQALRVLAQAENIDLNQLVTGHPGAAQIPQQQQVDPIRSYLDPLSQKVNQLETELQRRDRERVQSDIQDLAKDKPHFEKVRVAMGHLMNTGLIQGNSPKEAFDEAYSRACRMDPEVFAMIQAEEQAKREADAKAQQEAAAKKAAADEAERKRKDTEAVEKARKAGVSPRGGSPAGMAVTNKVKGQSVGDSIRAAVKEVRSTI